MAKNNNLTDYLTDLANAIREKKGTTDPINPQDFSAEIASIETGGGGGGGGAAASSEGDVNFRDYDGTILHSYTKEQFLALSALPELPTQPGLICQEWNYTFEDAKAHVQEYGRLEIGATYITDDGTTRLYIAITDKRRSLFPLTMYIDKESGLIIDWGDGSTESVTTTGTKTLTHNYNNVGNYVIRLQPTNGATLSLGNSSSSSSTLSFNVPYNNMVKKAEIGESINLRHSCFRDCFSLEAITIPKNIKNIGDYALYNAKHLKHITYPKGVTKISSYAHYNSGLISVSIPISVTSIAESAFQYSTNLRSVCIPSGFTEFSNYAFEKCYALEYINIPNSVVKVGSSVFSDCRTIATIELPDGATLGGNVFYNCQGLKSCKLPKGDKYIQGNTFYYCCSLSSVVLPDSLTFISSGSFYYCSSLTCLIIPKSVSTIEYQAFYGCKGVSFFDFREHEQVPKLSSNTAFSTTASDSKIVVPDELYDAWISASNWSSLASKIVKASEFTE